MTNPGRLILLVSVILTLGACSSHEPDAVAERYWQAVLQGDDEARRDLLAEPDVDGVSRYFDAGDGSEVSFGETQVQNNTARVTTHLKMKQDGEESKYQTVTVLVRQDADTQWLVDAAETRQAFLSSILDSTIQGLRAALEESASEFRQLGEEAAQTAAEEISKASEQIEMDTAEASEELDAFLKELDKEMVELLRQYSAQDLPEGSTTDSSTDNSTENQ